MTNPKSKTKRRLTSLLSRGRESTSKSAEAPCDSSSPSLEAEVVRHVDHYAPQLGLARGDFLLTTDRREFEQWLGRRVSASIGGAYIFLTAPNQHAILI